ncbi:MAG: hypothetical protein GDA55_08845, partial [Cellvibrionales bacterium]|nr:hypothetical protein [Cellvibrionales bacterium]
INNGWSNSAIQAAAFVANCIAAACFDVSNATATTITWTEVAVVATLGGITSVLQGGKFGHGFVAAGLTTGAGKLIAKQGTTAWANRGPLRRIATRATIGGTASAITGGKFGNGAITAGFAAALGESWESYEVVGSADKRLSLTSEREQRENQYSIKANDRELNPDGYALGNDALRDEVASLYKNLSNELGTENFQFKVTGGDRYMKNGQAYSSTDGSLIGKSGGAHLRGDAVDLRIKYQNDDLIPVNIVRPAVNRTNLIFDQNAMPHHYSDQHYHLQLPRGFKP